MKTKLKDAPFLLLFLVGFLIVSCGGVSSVGNTTTTASPVATHLVYLASTTGLTSYSSSDGKPLWSFQLSSMPFLSPQEPLALANGVVYWIADKLYALDATTGKQRWNAPIGNAPGAIYVSGNLVYVLSDTQLSAFAPPMAHCAGVRTSNRRWGIRQNCSSGTGCSIASMAQI